MADCECIGGCPFFNDKMASMPSMADIYKKQYCQGDNTNCARHMVFRTKGREHVPADMYPNMVAKANDIIEKAS